MKMMSLNPLVYGAVIRTTQAIASASPLIRLNPLVYGAVIRTLESGSLLNPATS